MRVLSAAAVVIMVLLGAVTLRHVSAQEESGHIQFSVRVCVGGPASDRVAGTFADVPCDVSAGAGSNTSMVISLDGGTFIDGTSTLTLPLAPILNGNLYLAPGDYTLTITSEQLSGPLVSSIDLHIVAGETLPLTYTVTYGLTVGSEPPPVPVDPVPEVPVDQPATPAVVPEVPVDESAVPREPVLIDSGEVPEPSDALSDPTLVTMLPDTGAGTGRVTSSSVIGRASLLVVAALGVIVGAATILLRRT